MGKKVYIVHCVDTEGPLFESLEATFERVNSVFGLDLYPSPENLTKLQKRELDLGGKEDAVAELVSPTRINTMGSWDQVDKMLLNTGRQEFRENFLDSTGGGWIYNWFCLDHVGFTGYNPRRRDAGYHNIYDHYLDVLKNNESFGRDMIQWHYHPIPLSGHYHAGGTAYVGSRNVFEILARKIIDRYWFPAAFRPGLHVERPDSHWFLEQWIPFDYANQSVKGIDTNQPDLLGARFGDWRRAPKEWVVYQPSHDDYQVPGNCRRWIARCLNMSARLNEITLEDFREGFQRAREGHRALISFTNHDFRDMKPDINRVRGMIRQVSREYPEVEFIYSNAVSAMRGVLNLKPSLPGMELKFEPYPQKNQALLKVTAGGNIFGPQPFLAVKTVTGFYYWDNLDFVGEKEWGYFFDWNSFNLDSLDKVGIGVNSREGVTEVLVYDVKKEALVKKVLHI